MTTSLQRFCFFAISQPIMVRFSFCKTPLQAGNVFSLMGAPPKVLPPRPAPLFKLLGNLRYMGFKIRMQMGVNHLVHASNSTNGIVSVIVSSGIKIFRVFSDFRVFPNFQDHSWDQCKSEEKPFHEGWGCGQSCTCVKPSSNQILTVAEAPSAFQSFRQKPVLIPVLVFEVDRNLTQDVNKSGKDFQMRKIGFLLLPAHENLIQYDQFSTK